MNDQKPRNLARRLRLHVCIVLFSLLFNTSIDAQKNLVPNPGFDSLGICPETEAQVKLAYPWRNAGYTPDLYHTCSPVVNYQPPHPLGCNYLPPKNGGGYIGMYVYFTHEMAETPLLQPLEKGKQYYARFFTAPDDNCLGSKEQSFTDAMAMGIRNANDPNSNFNLVAETSGVLLDDTSGWTKVSGCFVANGKENILQVGNFKSDAETIFETDQPNVPGFNYMFVDDFFLGLFDPFPDTVLLCEGVPTTLDATFLNAEYQWNTGSTGAMLLVSDTGRYVVKAMIDGCVFRDTVQVISLPPINVTVLKDTSLCDAESILLTVPLQGEYLWSNGSTEAQILIKNPGAYSVTVTTDCGVFEFSQKVEADNCRCRVFVPNVFSPNDDGYNDMLEISIGCEHVFTVEQFDIFDRWGGRVFSSKGYPLTAWDGKVKGNKASSGVYTWFLTYTINRNGTTRKITEQGDITLLR